MGRADEAAKSVQSPNPNSTGPKTGDQANKTRGLDRDDRRERSADNVRFDLPVGVFDPPDFVKDRGRNA
jgi:hypothetical protein